MWTLTLVPATEVNELLATTEGEETFPLLNEGIERYAFSGVGGEKVPRSSCHLY